MTRNILILSASVGAGHMRAAQAMELALKSAAPVANVFNVDVLTLTNAAFRKIYGEAYLELVNHAPHVLGYVYDLLDRPRKPNSRRDKLRLLWEKINLSKLDDLLESMNWDVVVNTHFLPAEILASQKKKRKSKLKQITVTTDFETHRLWVNQPCERYTTATEEGKLYLQHWGVPEECIDVTGIPIHPCFSAPKPRASCLKAQSLSGDRPIVLQLAGGFGVGPVEQIYRGILEVQTPLEVVVVAGKNIATKNKLEKIDVPKRHRAKVIGFTTEIDELMQVADLVVSKPGGLTTSEVLARGAAMAIVNPIPGQESRNSDYLLEHGAAIKINNLATLQHKLQQVLGDDEKIAALKSNAKKIGRPNSAADVAKIVLSM